MHKDKRTVITCMAFYALLAYSIRVWGVVYLCIGLTRASFQINELLHTFFVPLITILGLDGKVYEMTQFKDYQDKVVNELVQNKTLERSSGGGLFVPAGISNQEVYDAIIERLSPLLNDNIAEHYGACFKNGKALSQESMDRSLGGFCEIVNNLSIELVLNADSGETRTRLHNAIDARFLQ